MALTATAMAETELINGVKQWSLEELLEPKDADPSKNEKVMQWGFPGHMTQEEVDIYVSSREDSSGLSKTKTRILG